MSERQRPVVGDVAESHIVMGHGAGGRKMHRLIDRVFRRWFDNPKLDRLEDGAVLPVPGRRWVMSTDSYVVQPLVFPGGDIGKLAACGTINDLAVMGAVPRYLSAGFIIREGLSMAVLERACRSMARVARANGCEVVTGDTKVIEAGGDEGLYINTTGIGPVTVGVRLGPGSVRPGDAVLVNGGMGEHEAAIALARGTYRLRGRLRSDCAPLSGLVQALLPTGSVRMMRDPTRGGVATTLNEMADATGLGFVLNEALLPVPRSVRAVAEILGLDPLYMANEGKVLAVVAGPKAESALAVMRRHPDGRRGRRIGTVVDDLRGVWVRTKLGSLRPVIMLEGEQLPRIC